MFGAVYDSPLGPLYMVSDGEHLLGLWMKPPATECVPAGQLEVFQKANHWLDQYFLGNPLSIDTLPLSPSGTAFQMQVWEILKTIPYGKTISYGEIAKRISPTMSAQAVGQAVGKNPLSIIIPCHRVVGTSGRMTGYAWGIEKKQWLLAHEANGCKER